MLYCIPYCILYYSSAYYILRQHAISYVRIQYRAFIYNITVFYDIVYDTQYAILYTI